MYTNLCTLSSLSESIEWIPLVTLRTCGQIFYIKFNAVESKVALNEKNIVGLKLMLYGGASFPGPFVWNWNVGVD